MGSQDTEKTGWQRLTALLHSIWNKERPEELKELYKACIVSGVAGFMFGGYAQARRSRVHFIDTHNTYIFPSHMQAQRQLHSAVAIGFLRGGFLWGWKLGAFAGIFRCCEQITICHIGITVYRNKEGVLNIVTSGVVGGACYRLFIDGLSGMVKGAVLGTLVSIPASLVIVGIDKLFIGPDVRKEIERARLEVKRKKNELWLQRLEGTTDILADINSNDKSQGLDRHYELIPPTEDNIIKKFIDKATGFLFRTTDQTSNNKDSK